MAMQCSPRWSELPPGCLVAQPAKGFMASCYGIICIHNSGCYYEGKAGEASGDPETGSLAALTQSQALSSPSIFESSRHPNQNISSDHAWFSAHQLHPCSPTPLYCGDTFLRMVLQNILGNKKKKKPKEEQVREE